MNTNALLFTLQLAFAGPQLEIKADWHLSAGDRAWLVQYIGTRLQEARAITEFATGVVPPTLSDKKLHIYLHTTEFVKAGLLNWGLFKMPLNNEEKDLYVDVSWTHETLTGRILSHEFVHMYGFYSIWGGWNELGHGTANDMAAEKIADWIKRIYIPGHQTNPFNAIQ